MELHEKQLKPVKKAKKTYYQRYLHKHFSFLIPAGKKVMELGCGTGDLLNAISPEYGIGLDNSSSEIKRATSKYKDLNFSETNIEIPLTIEDGKMFDYVIISDILQSVNDVQDVLTNTKPFINNTTRLVISNTNYLWEFPIKILEKLHLKKKTSKSNWLSSNDILNLIEVSGFQLIKKERKLLCPIYIPLLSYILNNIIANLPVLNHLCMIHFFVIRPILVKKEIKTSSTSIVIPAKNEKGNIESAITRTPAFGGTQQFIFIEGHSSDGTFEEMLRVKEKFPEKNIIVQKQSEKGKGNAVREGFELATGDILMILDADLTSPPEDLPKFYDAINTNKGEFINGCRLVYPMEKEAMRFLNLIANKFFGLLFSYLIDQNVKDTLCGTKVLWKEDYIKIKENRAYFGDFDPFGDFDLLLGATKQNLKIVEIYVRYKDRSYGETQISRFKHGLLLFKMSGFAIRKIKFI